MSCFGESRAKVTATLLLLSLVVAGCSCDPKATLVSKGAGGTGGEPDGGMGGFIDPGFGGRGGEGGAGATGGAGGSGGEEPRETPCDRVCARVEGLCGLEVPGLTPDCPRQCEQALLEEEKRCLAAVKCSMEEVDRCLGRVPPDPEDHRCAALCPFVYDQCGRTMVDGIGLPIHPADCDERCPHLPDAYLDCLEAAKSCPAVDACRPATPPTACEAMCDHVYVSCGSRIDEAGRSHPNRQNCVAGCEGGDFTSQEIQCLTQAACSELPSCFPRDERTPCERLCDRVYDECNNAFPIGAHKDDKIDEEACVEACEDGEITETQRACLQRESCEYAATCFFPGLQRSCASACYWVHAWCGFYVQLYWVLADQTYPFEAETECHSLCEEGFLAYDEWWGLFHYVPPWSAARKTCYRDRASPMDPLECDLGSGHPSGMNHCATLDPK